MGAVGDDVAGSRCSGWTAGRLGVVLTESPVLLAIHAGRGHALEYANQAYLRVFGDQPSPAVPRVHATERPEWHTKHADRVPANGTVADDVMLDVTTLPVLDQDGGSRPSSPTPWT